jgi:hypothetical protein
MRTSGNEAWSAELKKRPAIDAAVKQVVAAEGPTIAWADFEQRNKTLVTGLKPDDGVSFWQLGETLVLGGQYRSPYGDTLLKAGGVEGTLIMGAAGVEVTGVSDQAAFRRAFAKLSSKSVSFV